MNVGVAVEVEVFVGIFVAVETLVGVFVGVWVGVNVAVGVGVNVAVPVDALWVMTTSCGGGVPSREENVTPSVLSATSAKV